MLKILPLVVALLLNACATVVDEQRTAARVGPLLEAEIDAWQSVQVARDQSWAAYYTPNSRLALRAPDGEERVVVDDVQSAPSGLGLVPDGEGGVWLAYRSKLPERGVFVVNSVRPGEPVKASGDTMPLSRMSMFARADGGADLLWYDETPQPDAKDEPYWLYYNRINADASTGQPLRLMPGIYPVGLADGDTLAVFSWHSKAGQIVLRKRMADGGFSAERVVAKVPKEISVPFKAVSAGGKWFVFWVALHGNSRADLKLDGAVSDDQGESWSPFTVDAFNAHDVRALETAVSGDGELALAVTSYMQAESEGGKADVYLMKTRDGRAWSKVERLRGKDDDLFNAPDVKLAYAGKDRGQLVVFVEDWKTIRPSISYWVQAPGKAEWAQAGRMLGGLEGKGQRLSYGAQSVDVSDDRVGLHYEAVDDSFAESYLGYESVLLKDLESGKVATDPGVPDIERLRQRVDGYGKAMVSNDYEGAYAYFDPFYRARVDFWEYRKTMGRIQYKVMEYKDAELSGALAAVQVHLVASVPPFRARNGKMMESAERDVVVPVRWVWIDNDWYMEYYAEGQGIKYTRY